MVPRFGTRKSTWRRVLRCLLLGWLALGVCTIGPASAQVMLRALTTNAPVIADLGHFHAGPLHWTIEGANNRDSLGFLTPGFVPPAAGWPGYCVIGAYGRPINSGGKGARLLALAWPLSNEPPRVLWSLGRLARLGPDGGQRAALGDIDGDGQPDLVANVRARDSLQYYLGTSNGFSNLPHDLVEFGDRRPSQQRNLEICDINADGIEDVIVALSSGSIHGGSAHLFLGSRTGLKTKPDWSANGATNGDSFGIALAVLDANGDGHLDLAITSRPAPSRDSVIHMFPGTNGVFARTAAQIVWAPGAGPRTRGSTLAAVGDLDRDGYDDLAVGEPGRAGTNGWPGVVYVFRGSPNGLRPEPGWTLRGPLPNSDFGSAICSPGDVNGDGWPELLVSAPGLTVAYGLPGQVFMFLGGPGGLHWRRDWQVSALHPRHGTGVHLAALGDINGDRLADFAIGSPYYTSELHQREQIGRIDIFFGHRDAYGEGATFPTDNTNSSSVAVAMDYLSRKYPEIAARLHASNSLRLFRDAETRHHRETNQFASLVQSKERDRMVVTTRINRLWLVLALGLPMLGATLALLWTRQRRRVVRASAEHERERLARDLHDGLGSGVHRVQRLTELLRTLDLSSEEARRYLLDLQRTTESLGGALNETIWAMKPENDTLANLVEFLAVQAPALLEPYGIACAVEIPPSLPDTILPGELRQHVLLSVKEAINNIAKHAAARKASLRVTGTFPSLEIVIEDDGRGIEIAPQGSRMMGGNGLHNLESRMASVGGTFALLSRPGGGTRITLCVPVGRRAQ